MIAYHIVPFQDGWRIHKSITELCRVEIGGRSRLRRVQRFEVEGAGVYPSRAAAHAVLCKLAEF
jgi:hypothetical protein